MTTDEAFKLGHNAYGRGEMRAPALNAEVMAAVAALPVGTAIGNGHARTLMYAFTRGFDAASLEEEYKLLAGEV